MECQEANSFTEEGDFKWIENLCKKIGYKDGYHNVVFETGELECLRSILKWPTEHLLPVLDLYRMYLLHPQASEMFKVVDTAGEFIHMLLGHLQSNSADEKVKMITLRCLVNIFGVNTGDYAMHS